LSQSSEALGIPINESTEKAIGIRPHDRSVSCLGQRPLPQHSRFGGCAGLAGAGPREWGKTGCRPARSLGRMSTGRRFAFLLRRGHAGVRSVIGGTVPHRRPIMSASWLASRRSAAGGVRRHFCHEAGPCGDGRHRRLVGMGHDHSVVAPSVIPLTAGGRVKTDRRGAVISAKRHRAGDLTALRVPGAAQEAGRDLVGARATAMRRTGTLAVNVAGQPFAFSVVSISADR